MIFEHRIHVFDMSFIEGIVACIQIYFQHICGKKNLFVMEIWPYFYSQFVTHSIYSYKYLWTQMSSFASPFGTLRKISFALKGLCSVSF